MIILIGMNPIIPTDTITPTTIITLLVSTSITSFQEDTEDMMDGKDTEVGKGMKDSKAAENDVMDTGDADNIKQ
jgi:hypothetical protein